MVENSSEIDNIVNGLVLKKLGFNPHLKEPIARNNVNNSEKYKVITSSMFLNGYNSWKKVIELSKIWLEIYENVKHKRPSKARSRIKIDLKYFDDYTAKITIKYPSDIKDTVEYFKEFYMTELDSLDYILKGKFYELENTLPKNFMLRKVEGNFDEEKMEYELTAFYEDIKHKWGFPSE